MRCEKAQAPQLAAMTPTFLALVAKDKHGTVGGTKFKSFDANKSLNGHEINIQKPKNATTYHKNIQCALVQPGLTM